MKTLILITQPYTGPAAERLRSLEDTAKKHGARLRPLLGDTSPTMRQLKALGDSGTGFFGIDADDAVADELLRELRAMGEHILRAAYFAPKFNVPTIAPASARRHARARVSSPLRESLSDFSVGQQYLDSGPGGMSVRSASPGRKPAWELDGGKGGGVRVIDVELVWNFDHQDLMLSPGSLIHGAMSNDLNSQHHGTAVAGLIVAKGVQARGIAPDATFLTASFMNGANKEPWIAIREAVKHLRPGDVLLLEFEAEFEGGLKLPAECDPRVFDAILDATSSGIIVVEPAGNGGQDLDDVDLPSGAFDPFATGSDSGAIIVGAGKSPKHGADVRKRTPSSNAGARVDAQGWGDAVVSTGYGDLQPAPAPNSLYTALFAETSSAAAMVAGAIASKQGQELARGGPLTPSDMRQWLRTTGTPQPTPDTGRIGNLPDLSS